MTTQSPVAAGARRAGRLSTVAGLLAVLSGVLCLVWPWHSLVVITLILAGYLLVSGAGAVVSGLRNRSATGSGVLVVTGIVGIVFAAVIAWHPGMSTRVVVSSMGLAMLLCGLLVVWLALGLRALTGGSMAWPLAGGILAAVLGLVFLISPGFGARALGVLLGVGAILFGLTFVVLGRKLRRLTASGRLDGSGPRPGDPGSVIIEGTVVDAPQPDRRRDGGDGPGAHPLES